MKHYIIGLIIIVIIIIYIFVSINATSPSYKQSYNANLLDLLDCIVIEEAIPTIYNSDAASSMNIILV